MPLDLHKVSEDATTITLGWTPTGNRGYRFSRSAAPGKWSHTWDATRSSARFSKDSTQYVVEVLESSMHGFYPSPPDQYVARRPTPPSIYTPPAGTSVSTSVDLVNALASGTPATIIVEDGTYTNSSYATVGAAHQVYARNLGGATLQFGVQSGSVNGPKFQGINWNVTDSSKTLSGYIAHMWGSSTGWQFLDCAFKGNDTIQAAVAVRADSAYENLIIRRCTAKNFHSWGFLIDSNSTSYNPTNPPILEDIYTENCVYAADAQTSNGVSEAGLWLGCKATLNRLWCHQVKGYSVNGTRGTQKAWQGLWIGTNVRNCTLNDILVTGFIAFGIYGYGPLNSDDSSTVTINRLETHWPVNVGHHQEWDNPSAAHHPNTQNVVVQNSWIQSQCVGVHYDQGTENSTVKNTVFEGQASACTNNYLEGSPGNLGDTTGNDYSRRLGGCAINSTAYVTSFPLWNVDGGPGE